MKRGLVIAIVVLVIVILGVIGYFVLFSGEEPLFAPPTDVKVKVGNAPPKITDVLTTPVPVALTPAATKNVLVQFRARDPNGASDLNTASAKTTFSRTGETSRIGSCSVNSQIDSKTNLYDCLVPMEYYDGAGDWTITFYIEDSATPTPGSDTVASSQVASVGQLKAISYNTLIDLGTITPGDADVPLADIVITNEGNFVTPADGNLNVLARDLIGVTDPSDSIGAIEFLVGDSSGNVCTAGAGLVDNSYVNTDVAIPRGPSGSNGGSLGLCIALVPEVGAQDYEATQVGGNPWFIEI